MVGVTGLVTASLLRSGLPADDPMVAAGLKNLLSHHNDNGGFYAKDSLQRNYETCITVFALVEANTDGKYDSYIKQAEGFLRELQWDKGEGIESSDPAWGGGGYGSHQRPDMSNTQYLIEALKQAGVKEDDPAMQNILVFVSRTQNLESSANTTIFAGKINDGGLNLRLRIVECVDSISLELGDSLHPSDVMLRTGAFSWSGFEARRGENDDFCTFGGEDFEGCIDGVHVLRKTPFTLSICRRPGLS